MLKQPISALTSLIPYARDPKPLESAPEVPPDVCFQAPFECFVEVLLETPPEAWPPLLRLRTTGITAP